MATELPQFVRDFVNYCHANTKSQARRFTFSPEFSSKFTELDPSEFDLHRMRNDVTGDCNIAFWPTKMFRVDGETRWSTPEERVQLKQVFDRHNQLFLIAARHQEYEGSQIVEKRRAAAHRAAKKQKTAITWEFATWHEHIRRVSEDKTPYTMQETNTITKDVLDRHKATTNEEGAAAIKVWSAKWKPERLCWASEADQSRAQDMFDEHARVIHCAKQSKYKSKKRKN